MRNFPYAITTACLGYCIAVRENNIPAATNLPFLPLNIRSNAKGIKAEVAGHGTVLNQTHAKVRQAARPTK